MRLLDSVNHHLSHRGRSIIGFAFLLFGVVFLLDFRVRALIVRGSFPDAADKYYLPPPTYLEVVSLGYREAAADLVWVATIQHAADRKFYSGKRFPWLEQYLDAVLALNPYLLKVYMWADGTLTYARGVMTNEDWLRSIHYLERGHRHFPRNWELLFKLACTYTELQSKDPVKRSKWRRLAANYLWKAHLVGGGPPWLASLAARYWSEEGQWLLAYRRALEEYKSTDHPDVKKELSDRLADLLSRSADGIALAAHYNRLALPVAGNPPAMFVFLVGEALGRRRVVTESARQLRAVSAQKERFDRQHQRCLPYWKSDLFVLLGPCVVPADGAPRKPPTPGVPRESPTSGAVPPNIPADAGSPESPTRQAP